MLIALTGGIGSGKSYTAKIFEAANISVIYADKLAREIILNNQVIKHKIQKYFNIADLNNNLNQNLKKIKTQIFKYPRKRSFLEKLVHPEVLKKIILLTNNNFNNNFIIEIPLVYNFFNILKFLKINHIILINCELNQQISRVMHRDRLSKSQIMLIIKSQKLILQSKLFLQQPADYVLNGNNLTQLHIQATALCYSLEKF